MLIWLASYPRSGNTLLRTILRTKFGLRTWSIYDDKGDIGSDENLAAAVGHISHERSPEDFLAWASKTDGLTLVKTHELPSDDHKAIYVIRDGRSAIISYYYYLNRLAKTGCKIEQVVLGTVWPGPWSRHVKAWALSGRPNTLVVRYDDLVNAVPATFEAIADFIERPALECSPISFESMQRISPEFFHRGSDEANIAELEADFPALYALIHGATAEAIGYPVPQIADFRITLQAEYDRLKLPA